MNVSIRDSATPAVRQLIKDLGGERMNRVIAESVLPVVQRHFQELAGSNKNKFGARSSFWQRMIAGTTAQSDAQTARVRMPREIALRFFGGTVTPKGGAKNLAIPARAEAYGKSPRDFNNLKFVMFASGAKALMSTGRQQRTDNRRSIGGAQDSALVFFWLTPSATIRPDPDVLPTDQTIVGAALNGVAGYVNLLQSRRAA